MCWEMFIRGHLPYMYHLTVNIQIQNILSFIYIYCKGNVKLTKLSKTLQHLNQINSIMKKVADTRRDIKRERNTPFICEIPKEFTLLPVSHILLFGQYIFCHLSINPLSSILIVLK